MTDRGVSTVLDASLATVLVGGALLVLAGISPPPTDDVGTDAADDTADLLAATTAEVRYSVSPGARRADESLLSFPDHALSGSGFRRTARGTIAAVLARATVGDVAVDGEELSHATDQLERRVGRELLSTLRRGDGGVQVRTVWRPFPGSSLRGRIVAGDTPPGDVAVHAATVEVTSGLSAVRRRATRVADRGYDAVAAVLANATVEGLFPPERSALSVRGEYPVSALATYRYLHAAQLFGTSVAEPIAESDVGRANRRLADALADRFERRLRARFPTPEAAARSATLGTVTVTVRTWSR